MGSNFYNRPGMSAFLQGVSVTKQKGFGTAGYNLEQTYVTGDRLISLLVLMTLAYTMTTIDGKTLKKMGVQHK